MFIFVEQLDPLMDVSLPYPGPQPKSGGGGGGRRDNRQGRKMSKAEKKRAAKEARRKAQGKAGWGAGTTTALPSVANTVARNGRPLSKREVRGWLCQVPRVCAAMLIVCLPPRCSDKQELGQPKKLLRRRQQPRRRSVLMASPRW